MMMAMHPLQPIFSICSLQTPEVVKPRRRFQNSFFATFFAASALLLQSAWTSCLAQPAPPVSQGEFLNAWHFNDTNFLSFFGDPPKAAQGLSLVPSWEGNAVKIAATNSLLQYREIGTNGTTTNIVCQNGTVFLWFLPNWNSGTGPGSYGRLIEMGSYTTNASYGWWSFYLDPFGTNLFFSGQTNGAGATYLNASINLTTNHWTFLALTYSSSNSFLFTNGTLCATGTGVAYFPGSGVRGSNGFCIGGSLGSQNLSLGRFEWMRTYNYPESAA